MIVGPKEEKKLNELADRWRDAAMSMEASGPECISVCMAIIEAYITHHAEDLADALQGFDVVTHDLRKNIERRFAEKGERIN